MLTDQYDLQRFIDAQESTYARALAEVKNGFKRSHWMWFIFPQFDGLGMSDTSVRYAIKSIDEAKAYLNHPILGPRLIEISEAALAVQDRTAQEVFGTPDNMKLKSCATLFASISSSGSVFEKLLEKYFAGKADAKTLELIGKK